MIEHTFKSDNNYETKKLAKFIETFEPKVKFQLEDTHLGKVINLVFETENEKDDFLYSFSKAINLSEDGTYLK